MIVLDASAAVEALVGRDPSHEFFAALIDDIHAPHLLDIEVLSALRKLELGGAITRKRASEAVDDYWALSITRHDAQPLAGRVWELRHQLTSYDAAYVALAESLDAPLVTCNGKLVGCSPDAAVRLIPKGA